MPSNTLFPVPSSIRTVPTPLSFPSSLHPTPSSSPNYEDDAPPCRIVYSPAALQVIRILSSTLSTCHPFKSRYGANNSSINATLSSTILIADNLPADHDTGDGDNTILSHGRHEINWQWGMRDATKLSVGGKSQDGYSRHSDGFVYVLVDGHAKWRKREKKSNGIFTAATKDDEWLANQP